MTDLSRWIRNPEYTGANRCVPCTIVNVGIALVVAIAIGVLSQFVELGVVVFVLALGIIWARGYLVPGTPTLTKRYLPETVLRWFGKEPPHSIGGVSQQAETVDPETFLREHTIVMDDSEVNDLVIDPSFEQSWWKHIERVRPTFVDPAATGSTDEGTTGRPEEMQILAEFLDTDVQHLSMSERGQAFTVSQNGRIIGQWESRSAFVADLAAARALADRLDEWEHLEITDQSAILGSLRLFLERCPKCESPVQLEQDIVESCCRSYNVIAATCTSCGDRIFESEVDEELDHY